jgi:hypothetical protein
MPFTSYHTPESNFDKFIVCLCGAFYQSEIREGLPFLATFETNRKPANAGRILTVRRPLRSET